MRPVASVLIPFADRTHLRQTVASALDQTIPVEVLLFDDTAAPGHGVVYARNTLAACATGEWLQFLDHDDWLAADKIERQLSRARWDTDAIWDDCLFVGADRQLLYHVDNIADSLRASGHGSPPGSWLIRRNRCPAWVAAAADDQHWQIAMLDAGLHLRWSGGCGYAYRWDWSPNQISAQPGMAESVVEAKKKMRHRKDPAFRADPPVMLPAPPREFAAYPTPVRRVTRLEEV